MEDVAVPRPADREVLIRVRKTSVCGTDLHILRWDQWAQETIKVPMVIGHEFMGEIVGLGVEARGLEVGQRVSGEGHITWGIAALPGGAISARLTSASGDLAGAFAEQLSLPENVFPV
jgi:threonine 3-dehydrogenase